jgi:Spy/CpxP family protein refolding chaperone
MKKAFLLCLLALSVWSAGSVAPVHAQAFGKKESLRTDEEVTNSKLNNKRLEKNLDRFASELELSKRQQKQLKKIDRRYSRMERKLSKRDDTKRRDKKMLAQEKRNEIIEVLTPEQQQRLEALSKKGRFSLDQLFGK